MKSCSLLHLFPAPRFNEFVVQLQNAPARFEKLAGRNIVPGLPLERFYPELTNSILVCVTETTRREEIDVLAESIQ
jgi:glycine dehydrogenase subunit 1